MQIFGGIRKLKLEKKSSKLATKGGPSDVLTRSLKILEEINSDDVNDKGIQALQELQQVTENEVRKARIDLVHKAEAKLVPLLLHMLMHICPPKSHAHNLTLVLLNNLSTETENQRFIALDCGGVKTLAQLLCEDPSCHLVAICLVNLSFSSVAVRRDWVAMNKDLQWMHALTFCIRVGSMTRDEYHLVQPFLEEAAPHRRSPVEFLAILQADRHRGSSGSGSACFQIHQTLPPTDEQLFPETVRWCLCILKNLTRPNVDVNISDLVFASGIVPFLFQCITICEVKSRSSTPSQDDPAFDDRYDVASSRSSVSSLALNSPENWTPSSMEDAALYVLLNLAASDRNHQRLVDMNAFLLLSLVVQFAESHEREGGVEYLPDYLRVLDFQSLKARMAISYILGSRGHFGQPPQTLECLDTAEEMETHLTMTKTDAIQLLELLANTLHNRGKSGAGGYSAFVIGPKMVLKAIRCLLVVYKNQVLFSEITGTRLNSLLLKAIALHVFGGRPHIDAEAAEDAAVSLYLQSNHGFNNPFLPTVYGVHEATKGTAARVLAAFARTKSMTPAGKHASQQLVQRVAYLKFGSSDRDVSLAAGTFELYDFLLPTELLKLTKLICLPTDLGGVTPTKDLYDRPLLRRRAPRSGEISWNTSTVDWFPNALVASQDLVFASIVKHSQVPLDDIEVATVIAQCADGDIPDAFNYIWAWQDDTQRIKTFFETSFHPCAGQRGLTSKFLQQAVGRFSGSWACGKSTVLAT